jgi:Cysteine rich repeat
MSKRDIIFTLLVLFLLSVSGTSASSPQPASTATGLLAGAKQTVQQEFQPAAGLGNPVQICQSDVSKFCAKEVSQDEKVECLQDHFGEVSSACHARLQKTRDSFAPCKKEIGAYCMKAGYGGGKMLNCLRAQASRLSSACAERVK